MALIRCENCGKEISSKAIKCVGCGCLITGKDKTSEIINNENNIDITWNKHEIFLAIMMFLICIVFTIGLIFLMKGD